MDANINIPALEKLLDYAASGIGSIAGPLLATWKAKQNAQAILVEAEAKADSLKILAKANTEAREILTSQDLSLTSQLDITNTVKQRIQFQEQKRQANIEAVVRKAANHLGDTTVKNCEPDHDWTARFFNDVQDISSEEMQSLWSKVLAGEVCHAGSTSIHTLSILKDLDQNTARLLQIFCSACMYTESGYIDARVPSLGGYASQNFLQPYGLPFDSLNQLNEHGLIISDYHSSFDYRQSIGVLSPDKTHMIRAPFRFQNRFWLLTLINQGLPFSEEIKISGPALSQSGKELSRVVEIEMMESFSKELEKYFENKNLHMKEVASNRPEITQISKT